MKKSPGSASRVFTGDILARLDERIVEVDGLKMSALEAKIRVLYARCLSGDVSASVDLQKLRDECQVEDSRVYGVLLLPEPLSEEEWERAAAEQQAQFRSASYAEKGL